MKQWRWIEFFFSRVMRTEDHVDHDDGLNEQDDGNNDSRDDDDTTINCWRRFGGVGTSWDGDGLSFLSRMRMMSTASTMAQWGGLWQR